MPRATKTTLPQLCPHSLVICQEDARTQHIVVLIAVIYFSKRLKAKSAKGKGEHSGDQGKPSERFQGSSVSGVTQDVLPPTTTPPAPPPEQVVRTHVEGCPPRGLLGDSAPMVFIGVHHADTTYQACMNISEKEKSKQATGVQASLVVQWLRIHLPMQGAQF